MPAFSNAQLASVNNKAESIWDKGDYRDGTKAETGTVNAVLDNQTAKIEPMLQKSKGAKVALNWLKGNVAPAQDLGINAGNNCTIIEGEGSTAKKEYEINRFFKSGFSINEDEVENSSYGLEEAIARLQLIELNKLDETVNSVVAANAAFYAGTNNFLNGYTFDAASKYTEIPTADFKDPILMAYLRNVAIRNRMRDSYLVDSGYLSMSRYVASKKADSPEGKVDNKLYSETLPIYEDLIGFQQGGLTADVLMLAKNAIAVAHVTKYGSAPKEYNGTVNQTRYSVKSPTIKGMYYDAYYTYKCNAPIDATKTGWMGEDSISHHIRYIARFGVYQNPYATATETGSLAFAAK